MRLIPQSGVSGGDLPALSGRTGDFEKASDLGVPAGRRVLGLRHGAVHAPGEGNEGRSRKSVNVSWIGLHATSEASADKPPILKNRFDSREKIALGISLEDVSSRPVAQSRTSHICIIVLC